MKATITSIDRTYRSRHGGVCALITFMGEDGKSYRSWLYPNCGNYQRWIPVIEAGVGSSLDELTIKGHGLINADSFPKILEEGPKRKYSRPPPLFKNRRDTKARSLLDNMRQYFKDKGIFKK